MGSNIEPNNFPSFHLFAIEPRPTHHFVGRLHWVQQTLGLFGTCHRKQCRVEESDLDQERRLIPIDVLVRDVTSLVEAHHYDVRQHTLRPVGATPGR